MIAKNKTIQKFISTLIIISMLTPAIFLSFQPKKAEAWGIVWDPIHTAVTVKIVVQEIFKQFLMILARRLLNKMTQSTIAWINSGFHGNPLYLERPESFFKDIVKFEVKALIDLYGYDSRRYPFGKDFALSTIGSYQRQLADNSAYTLSKVISDPVLLNSYRNDFNVGGWNGFLINTQYPQNNYIGFQMMANEELARRLANNPVSNNIAKVQDTLQKGLGFLSPQTCPDNGGDNVYNKTIANQFNRPTFDANTQVPWTEPQGLVYCDEDVLCPDSQIIWDQAEAEWNDRFKNTKEKWDAENTCKSELVSTTPGSVVGQQIKDALGSSGRRGELAQALGNSVAAILDTLMMHFLDKGLNALGNALTPGKDRNGNPLIPPDGNETLDDFEFFGDTVRNAGTNNVPEPNYDPVPIIIVGDTTRPGGGQCAETGNQYAGDLGEAMNAVLDANPELAESLNTVVNGRAYMALVETELQSRGFGADDTVLNGNNNPNTGDLIALWMDGDTMMERYDTIISGGGNDRTLRAASSQQFVGFIPLNCTTAGGGKNCGCTSGGKTTPPEPVCTPPKVIENNACVDPTSTDPGVANITSISPTSAQPGVTTITINGTNLTNQVSFYDGAGNRNTVVGTVNTAKTQTTVLVPASQPTGNATVKIYQGNSVWSNGILITIGNTGGAGNPGPNVPTVTPTSSWQPSLTTDNWYPQLSPDGNNVTYGNLRTWIAEPSTNTQIDITPTGESRCWGGYWIQPTTITFYCEAPNLMGHRYEATKASGWNPVLTADNPNLVAGNQFTAADGHWASFLAGAAGRLVRDNVVLVASGAGGGVSISGNQLIHACDNNGATICLRQGTSLLKTITPQVPNNFMTLNTGYIAYGNSTAIRGINPVGGDINLKLSPLISEWVNKIIFVNGVAWVVTQGEAGTSGYIFLRPWGSMTAIAIAPGGQHISVAISGTDFVIASNNGVGRMTLITVPINSPRSAVPQ